MTQDQSDLWPFTILAGGDAFLAERTMKDLRGQALRAHPHAEVVELDAAVCDPYEFDEAVNPSLLSDSAVVLVDRLDDAKDALGAAMVTFCEDAVRDPAGSSIVICRHSGGNKGRRLLAALAKSGAHQRRLPKMKRQDDRMGFVLAEFRRFGRRIKPPAAQMLVSVLGDRTAELAAMCEQLCFDFDTDPMTLPIVSEYLTDNPQASSFNVADLAFEGKGAEAIVRMREAIEQGVDVVAIVGAMAFKMRILAKVAAAGGGRVSPEQVGVSSWQIRMNQRQLPSWSSKGLAKAVEAVANADEQRKGRGGDPVYAMEQAIRVIASRGKS
ncbi:DNA polymerase III subunit delta [Bifidobacterium xylocopae]|uniref:DNA-directed DNA polymerase n=1 Tax=Bifidobacterium xylocopae TaxID=2493119 RepID=A0A366KB79_9BIFI|nr:DNA polymerase III subunit delta [Bifidobacterium xylocopae]RBP98985.1 DNA polymerase III subunit delta [Bifidobacterium xylocopae]